MEHNSVTTNPKEIVRQFGHAKKFAKHVVALAIKQLMGFTDGEFANLVGRDEIGESEEDGL